MNKQKFRSIIYESNMLRPLWLTLIKFKDKYRYFHIEIFNAFYYLYLIRVKGYKEMVFDKKIVNGMFKIFTDEKSLKVIKVIRRDNYSSAQFYRKLKERQNYKEYCNTLKSASNMELIDEHIGEVLKIFKNGGYESPYINGANLQVLKKQMIENKYMMSAEEYRELLLALEKLYRNLYSYNSKYGSIPGDWEIYNLVYNLDLKIIVNVDLEGFYTWKESSTPNNIKRIQKDIENIKKLIHHKLSASISS